MLDFINLVVLIENKVTWQTYAKVNSKYFEFLPNDGVIKICQVQYERSDA